MDKKKAEEILQRHIDKESMDELSANIWPDMIDAMLEFHAKLSEELPSEEEGVIMAKEYANLMIKHGHDYTTAYCAYRNCLKDIRNRLQGGK